MCPCKANDVYINPVDGPSGSPIAGVGHLPFSIPNPAINIFPADFPEDLANLFDKLQMLLPPGALKPGLSVNYGKDILDAILSLIDRFVPFLMMYKFFLPVLNLIICMIEVLCALKNPFKLVRAIRRLFRKCLPDFLNLFPIFALIAMLLSLLALLLALIEYIISQIKKLINAIIRNIKALYKAMPEANNTSILAIANKIGSLLCIFQNVLVLLAIFNTVFQVIKDILSMAFSIPPCDTTDPSDVDGCCTPDVCPSIVKSEYTLLTGTLQYYNEVGVSMSLPAPFDTMGFPIRSESWQLYDTRQTLEQRFINITDAYDVPPTVIPKPVFFPTDVNYNASTVPAQAAYTVDLEMMYKPILWGREGFERPIIFKDCIITNAPTIGLSIYDNTTYEILNGVVKLAGGLGYEADGTTILYGYNTDGVTQSDKQATLENFIHQAKVVSVSPILTPNDGYTFYNIKYTFKPHFDTLFSKELITLGCNTGFAQDKTFINTAIAGDAAIKFKQLGDYVNGPDFPNPEEALQCMLTAISAFRSNVTLLGAAQLQATTTLCLDKLRENTQKSFTELFAMGVEPCNSNFTINANKQFTSKPIVITVNLKDRNQLLLTTSIPETTAVDLASRIKGYPTLGDIDNFIYDGYSVFTANLTSEKPGKGQLMISFDNNVFCTNTIPTDQDIAPTHDLQTVDYEFVYAPALSGSGSDGKSRRDETDTSSVGN